MNSVYPWTWRKYNPVLSALPFNFFCSWGLQKCSRWAFKTSKMASWSIFDTFSMPRVACVCKEGHCDERLCQGRHSWFYENYKGRGLKLSRVQDAAVPVGAGSPGQNHRLLELEGARGSAPSPLVLQMSPQAQRGRVTHSGPHSWMKLASSRARTCILISRCLKLTIP